MQGCNHDTCPLLPDMISRVTLDFETYSEANLKKVGAWRYSEHPSTDIICLSYVLDDGEPSIWTPDFEFPAALDLAIRSGAEIEAHGSQFERAIWQNVGRRLYKFPSVFPSQWRCSMAASAYRALPLSLEGAAEVLLLEHQKDMEGHRVMMQVSKPDKKRGRRYDLDKLQRTYDYCAQDTRTERGLSCRVGPLPAPELETWRLDQLVNERGIRVDMEAVEAALEVTRQVKARYSGRLEEITNRVVSTADQVKRIVEWCRYQGTPLENLNAITVDQWLDTDLPDSVREVLTIRQKLGKASTKKYRAMADCVCDDGRARGLLQYHGANTGRWTGRLIQPHNFARGGYKGDPDDLVGAILCRDAEFLDMTYGDAMEALSCATRMMLTASGGNTLVAGDFKTIEFRVLMVLAGQTDIVKLLAEGGDPYVDFGLELYSRAITKERDPGDRQISKHAVLGLGYQMGAPKFVDQVFENSGGKVRLSLDFAERAKRTYREVKYPEVPRFWRGLEDAAIRAALTGKRVSYSDVTYEVRDGWLSCRLPSGRRLWYWNPRIVDAEMPWNDQETDEPEVRPQLHYDAQHQGRWETVAAYGGHHTGNVVQAIARDIMVEAMHRVERAGLPVVLTVHDEIVTDTPLVRTDMARELTEIMEERPSWASHYPIAVEAWQGWRYRK